MLLRQLPMRQCAIEILSFIFPVRHDITFVPFGG